MNGRLKQLRDLVVALDRSDRNVERLSPEAYRASAKQALALTHQEMGLMPIGDFAGPVSALQTCAENIFFGLNGRFADIDATGRAPLAFTASRALMARMRSEPSVGAMDEIAEGLFARLRGSPARRYATRR